MKKKPIDVSLITNKEFGIPEDLADFLQEDNLILLKCYLANYTYCQMSAQFGQGNREKILEKLLFLGEELVLYRILNEDLPCLYSTKPDFIAGWRGCLKELRRRVHGTREKWKALKGRNKK